MNAGPPWRPGHAERTANAPVTGDWHAGTDRQHGIMTMHEVTAFGAVGDGVHDDGPAIQAAIDACTAAGGGIVRIPGGRIYRSTPLRMKARVELVIETGAVLRASDRPEDYPKLPVELARGEHYAFLFAHEAHGAAISGGGTIDGQGRRFMTAELPHMYKCTRTWRPHLCWFLQSDRLSIRDITITDSAQWTLHFTGCNDVEVRGIRILNDLKVPNCDGIDPDHSRNVRIIGCHIEAGDDCIVVKNRKEHAELGPSEDIVIQGCTLVSTSCALKIGTESHGDFRRIVMSNCVIRGSHRGFGIQLRDWGTVEDVMVSDCIIETRHFHEDWWGAAEPIHLSAFPRRPGEKPGRIRRIRLKNLLCRGEAGAVLLANAPGHLSDIVLDGVQMDIRHGSRITGGFHDRRPCAIPGVVQRPVAGFHARQVAGLHLHRCSVTWDGSPRPWWGHALEAHGCADLQVEAFSGSAGRSGVPAQRIEAEAASEPELDREQRGNEAAK